MIRIQAQPDRIDPAEEKKKTRENVLANVATFALLIALIKSGKLVSVGISHLPSQKKDSVLGQVPTYYHQCYCETRQPNITCKV
jgi:hypothetical protein